MPKHPSQGITRTYANLLDMCKNYKGLIEKYISDSSELSLDGPSLYIKIFLYSVHQLLLSTETSLEQFIESIQELVLFTYSIPEDIKHAIARQMPAITRGGSIPLFPRGWIEHVVGIRKAELKHQGSKEALDFLDAKIMSVYAEI